MALLGSPRATSARAALGRVALTAVLANSTWFSATAVVPALSRDWGLARRARRGCRSRSRPASSPAASGRRCSTCPTGSSHGADRRPRRSRPRSANPPCSSPAARRPRSRRASSSASRSPASTRRACGSSRPTSPPRAGLATGVVVGALTLGSATPHLVRALGDVPWQTTIVGDIDPRAARGCGDPAGARPGRTRRPRRRWTCGAAVRALRERPLRLDDARLPGAHVGALRVLGLAADVLHRVAPRRARRRPRPSRDGRDRRSRAIGVAGLVGSVGAGCIADRVGRTAHDQSSRCSISAACCLASPLAFDASTAVLCAVLVGLGRGGDRGLGAVLGRRDRAISMVAV